MQDTPAPHAVYAIRYAHHARRASENFIGGDPHDGPMPLDYFVWAIVDARGKAWVVDTGFDAATGAARRREVLRDPAEGLRLVGIDPDAVEDVIVTHLHYDHAGNHHLFPRARFHLQDREMQYATGRCMCHGALRAPFAVEDVKRMVERVFTDRVVFHDGDATLAPGLSVHRLGGHTMGLQIVRVWTTRGWLVLASDAAHLYANMETGRPFPIVHDVAAMLEGHRRAYALASAPELVIPGHDPLVMERFPPATPASAGIVVRLDASRREA
jgi:glyoxylase-like metal-dependent hydrolase (beta-lactamase superfamily II)